MTVDSRMCFLKVGAFPFSKVSLREETALPVLEVTQMDREVSQINSII